MDIPNRVSTEKNEKKRFTHTYRFLSAISRKRELEMEREKASLVLRGGGLGVKSLFFF